MKSYHVANADFVEVINTEQPDLSLLATNKACGSSFVEIVKHTTDKSLEGSSMRTQRGIIVKAYSSVSQMIKPSGIMIVHNVPYGNLEVSEIVGEKSKVLIQGWA